MGLRVLVRALRPAPVGATRDHGAHAEGGQALELVLVHPVLPAKLLVVGDRPAVDPPTRAVSRGRG